MQNGDFKALRMAMVKDQMVARGIRDPRVLDAMREVPRHLFVPALVIGRAYYDAPLAIGGGQTISQPYMVALMSEMLELRPSDRVLEIGTGSGYQAAVLTVLAKEVVSIERVGPLAARAERTLYKLGYENITVIEGDGTLGYADLAPYDAIVVTAGAPARPETLCGQLAQGGRLVCPVGARNGQRIVRYTRTPEGLQTEEGVGCVFVPLIGAEGWSDREW